MLQKCPNDLRGIAFVTSVQGLGAGDCPPKLPHFILSLWLKGCGLLSNRKGRWLSINLLSPQGHTWVTERLTVEPPHRPERDSASPPQITEDL